MHPLVITQSLVFILFAVLFYPAIAQEYLNKLSMLQHLVRPPDTLETDSGIIFTSDSACFILPPAGEVLKGRTTPVQLVPRCSVDSVIIFVRHSFSVTDTLARLYRPPYRTEWNYAALPDQDQIHLQFGYKLFHPMGKTIISRALPNRWAIDHTTRKSKKAYHCRPIISPDTVIIDGKLDEWKNARRGHIGTHGLFALRWTGTRLYFAAEILSNKITPSDIIELHLDPKRTRGTFAAEDHRSIRFGPHTRSCWLVSFNNDPLSNRCDSIAALFHEEMTWSVSITDTGYTIEAALPFCTLSDLEFPKHRSGLDVTVCSGEDPSSFSAWANSTEYNRYNPGEWGTIVLEQPMLLLKILIIITLVVAGIIGMAIFALSMHHFFETQRFKRNERNGGSETLELIRAGVNDNLRDPSLNIEKVAGKTGLSTDVIGRTLREELDSSFERFLGFNRTNAAKELLRNYALSIEDITRQCGFVSIDDMTAQFRTYVRTDPDSFRIKIREMASEEDDGAGKKDG